MDVILLETVRNLGSLGDKVAVAGGYGRNFLIPTGKAVPATKKNIADFELRRADFEKLSVEGLVKAQARKEKITTLSIVISARAADDKLYGSIGPKEVADAVTKLGVVLVKSEVRMPSGPIRIAGEHTVSLQLHSDVVLDIVVKVVAAE